MAKKCDEMQRLFLIRLDNYVIVYFKQYVFFTISEFKTQTNKFQPKNFFLQLQGIRVSFSWVAACFLKSPG